MCHPFIAAEIANANLSQLSPAGYTYSGTALESSSRWSSFGSNRFSPASSRFHGGRLGNGALHQGQQTAKTLLDVPAQIDANGAAMAVGQRLEITQCLRLLEHTEGEFLAWDFDFVDIVGGYLDEHAAVGTAFVQLPGGVQEARAVAGGGCDFLLIANGDANLLQ